jgi:excisionase family DNA binding protein
MTTRAHLDPPSQAVCTEWLNATEAAEYLRLPTTKALYQRVARGQIKKPLRFGRQFRFRRRDLDALMRPA